MWGHLTISAVHLLFHYSSQEWKYWELGLDVIFVSLRLKCFSSLMAHSTTSLQMLLFKQVCINPLWISLIAYLPSLFFLTERYLGWHPSFARVKHSKTTVCGSFDRQSSKVLKNLSTGYSKPRIQLTEKMQDPYEPVPCNSKRQETLARPCSVLLQVALFHFWQHWTIILPADTVPDVWYNGEGTTQNQILIMPILVFQYVIPLNSRSLQNK